MDIVSPLSLLEVTMSEEIGADDDCIIIEDNDGTPNNSKINSWNTPVGEKMEVEVDPLFVGTSGVYNDKQNHMPTLWVTTNITNLAGVPPAELEFRKSQYSNVYEVLTEILHCTICLEHVGCDIRIHPSSIEHPILRVLICGQCACMYRTVNFIMNDKGKEINCRWCGKVPFVSGPPIRTCQQCPFSFCEVCLGHNCPDYLKREPRFPWICVVCNAKVLWPARATLWALHCLKSILLSNPGNNLAKINGDISLCCKNRKKKKKVVVDALQSLSTSDGFDLDQLVPPHLLNGATDVELYRTQLPEVGFPTQKFNALKSKAKPRPKSNTKPKPKPKPNAANSAHSVPANVPSVLHQKKPITPPSETKKPHWLRQKLIGYINDFNQLRTKLEDIEKSLDFDEYDPRTEEKVDNVSTLLSLHRELLNSCRLSLINEWKERKARAVIENYKSEVEEITEIKDITPPKIVQEKVLRKKVPTKPNTRKKQNTKPDLTGIKYVNSQGSTFYPMKDCFVRLEKIDLALPYFDKQLSVKKEQNDNVHQV